MRVGDACIHAFVAPDGTAKVTVERDFYEQPIVPRQPRPPRE